MGRTPAPNHQDLGTHKSLINMAVATMKIIIIIIKNQCSFKSNIPATNIPGDLLSKSIVAIRPVLILQGTPVSWPAGSLGLRTWQEVPLPFEDPCLWGGWERPCWLPLHSPRTREVMAKHFELSSPPPTVPIK